MTDLLGKRIRNVSHLGDHEIRWRDCVSAGHCDVEVLKYNIYKYESEDGGEIVPVFVQHDWTIDNVIQVNHRFQYGDWSGKSFLVLHDKNRCQPPQQSFLCADVADLILPDDVAMGGGSGFGFGVGTFGFMDRLKDFDVNDGAEEHD